MCIFKASFKGEEDKHQLKRGEIYGVNRVVQREDGKSFVTIEEAEGEYDISLFNPLENKGTHILIGDSVPKVGSFMRLVKNKTDMNEVVTGTVRLVEKSIIPGVYVAYTDKAMYEVSTIK